MLFAVPLFSFFFALFAFFAVKTQAGPALASGQALV